MPRGSVKGLGPDKSPPPIPAVGTSEERPSIRRAVLDVVVENPFDLTVASTAERLGLQYEAADAAVQSLRLSGHIKPDIAGARLLATDDGVLVYNTRHGAAMPTESDRATELHSMLLNRGPMGGGLLAKRMSLSRRRVTTLCRQLEAEKPPRARQEGNGRKRVWVGIPVPESRCDPPEARPARSDPPSQGQKGNTGPAPTQEPSSIDAPVNIDEPQRGAKSEEPAVKDAAPAPAAPSATNAAGHAGRSGDSLERVPSGVQQRAIYEWIREHPGSLVGEIREGLPTIRRGSLAGQLTHLRRGGYLRSEGSPFRWSVATPTATTATVPARVPVPTTPEDAARQAAGDDWAPSSRGCRRHRDGVDVCGCPGERCWYNEQVARRINGQRVIDIGEWRHSADTDTDTGTDGWVPTEDPEMLGGWTIDERINFDWKPMSDDIWFKTVDQGEADHVCPECGGTHAPPDCTPIAPVVDLEQPETDEDKHLTAVIEANLDAARRARAHLTVELAKVNGIIAALEAL